MILRGGPLNGDLLAVLLKFARQGGYIFHATNKDGRLVPDGRFWVAYGCFPTFWRKLETAGDVIYRGVTMCRRGLTVIPGPP